MANLKLAYGDKVNLSSAIASGKIPPATLILTKDSNELYFYNLDGSLNIYKEKYKFDSLAEAEYWVSTYNCTGQILSVQGEDSTDIYLVNEDNTLSKYEKNAIADWAESDPDSQSYIKNKPVLTYVHEQMSQADVWEIHHNMNKYPSVSVVDSAGNLVVGDVKYIDTNNLQVIFAGAFSGNCYCN